MSLYENPNCVPLEELQLNIKNDGVIVVINALNEKWADKRYFLRYEEPEIYNEDGSEIEGAKDYWLEIVNYIIEDLNWLLNLPFYQFWSNIVYNTSIMDTLVSFLQEAPPFYALENFPNEPKMLEALENLRRNILIVFARLCTNKQSPSEYMKCPFLGNLLYDNYIFTIPIIFDLCQLYGRENAKIVEKIVQDVFNVQPMYNDDLQKSVPCLIKALQNVERRFENSLSNATEAVALSERKDNSAEMTLYNLEDLILYILDVSSTLTVLLKSYPPVTATFHRDDFINKIVSLYGNTIPEMYKKLDKLAYSEESMPKYIELKHRLDVTRVEMLNLYRIITYEPILKIQEKMNTITEDEIRTCIDEYLNSLMTAISEKEFIMDFHRFYPINVDLDIMTKLCPELDTIKHDYILQALHASIGNIKTSNASLNNTNIAVAGCSGIQGNQQKKHSNDVNGINSKTNFVSKEPENIMSLIQEVKEILSDYGEGFIQLCLKHYNYNVESVINALLEDSLPNKLKKFDTTIPYIPPDLMEEASGPVEFLADANLANNFQESTVSHNDDLEVVTEDFANALNIGKKKDKYRNANELLNDKSDIKKSWNIYEKYSLVDEYDDEYDDTYDSHNIRSSVTDDSTEIDGKSFRTPRVFHTRDKNNTSSEDETEDEQPVQNNKHFVQNPAELRAKAEQRRQQCAREGNNAHGKGQKQQDNGSVNKKKTVYKSTRRNSYRRMGAQIKRRQGMVPS